MKTCAQGEKMKISRKPYKPPRIEMLPLIDMVFLLLVFFIYAMLSMSVHRGRQVDLPSSSMAEATPAAPICVTLKRDLRGTLFFVNDTAVSEAELTPALEEQARLFRARGTEPVVQLDAEKNLSYQEIYTALDRINRAGLNRVFLQASPVAESSP